ncbi:MAG: hypothetical protein WD512_16555 [Candidatus Paceibacterota bacterium]
MDIFVSTDTVIDILKSIYEDKIDIITLDLIGGKQVKFMKVENEDVVEINKDKDKYRYIEIKDGKIQELSNITKRPDIIGKEINYSEIHNMYNNNKLMAESYKKILKGPNNVKYYPEMYLYHETPDIDKILKNGWLKPGNYVTTGLRKKSDGSDKLVFMMTSMNITDFINHPLLDNIIIFRSNILIDTEFFINDGWKYDINKETKRYKYSDINEINRVLLNIWINEGYNDRSHEIMVKNPISLRKAYKIIRRGKEITKINETTFVKDPNFNSINDEENKCSKGKTLCHHALENQKYCCNNPDCTKCLKL